MIELKAKLVIAMFTVLMIVGIFQGEAAIVYRRAVLVCLSCLGIR